MKLKGKLKSTVLKNIRFILISLSKFSDIKYILFILGLAHKKYRGLSRKKLIYLDCSNNSIKTIRPEYNSYSYGHMDLSGNYDKLIINIPEIKLYQFENAQVVSNSSHIITDTTAYVERVNNITSVTADYSTGLIFDHSDKFALVESQPILGVIEKAMFLGGNGSFNYYHWLIEILPKLRYFSESLLLDKAVVILLSKKALDIPSFYEILQKALNMNMDNVIFMEPDAVYLVDDLYHMASPNNLVFNLRGQKFNPSFSYFRYEALDYVKNLAYSLSASQNYKFTKDLPTKIFLARKSTMRNYNQEEIVSLVKNIGFESVYLEDYTFSQQVEMFKNAKVIIGPTGAAWTNLIFCRPNVKCLCWMSKTIGDFSGFSNLAIYAQVNLYYINHEYDISSEYYTDYVLNADKLLHTIEKICH